MMLSENVRATPARVEPIALTDERPVELPE
jgi:hypothetical protein